MALIAVYLATFVDYLPFLAPGERATVMIIAADRRQARTVFRYIQAFLTNVPMLRQLIEVERRESFDLANRVSIEVSTASFKTVRGYAIPVAICDEICFWPQDDSASPDVEILNALRPAMAQFPNRLLLCASSPYAKRGAAWDAFSRHFGKDDSEVLVWRAPTRVMNPSIPQEFIDAEYAKDPASAAAEYGAEFRGDLEAFITREAVEACIERGTFERPTERRNHYVAFVDPSGGSNDSMTLAIAHREGNTAILDAMRETFAPFSPEAVVQEFADLLKRYRVVKVWGDRFGGEWCRETFRRHGIIYEPADKPKSAIYRDFLPLVNSGGSDLLDSDRLVNQLVALERQVHRGGKDNIDHPRHGRDDLANAAAGAVVTAAKKAARSNNRPPITHYGVGSYSPLKHTYRGARA